MHSLPGKTLLLRLSSIGDIVLSSPLIRNLRKTFPEMQLDFLVKSEFADLVRYNPYLSRIIEVDTSAGLRKLTSVGRSIRGERYDVLVDLHGSLRSIYLRFLSGARKILKVEKRRVQRWMLVRFKRNLYGSVVSVADRYLEPLKPYGISGDGEGLELYVPDQVVRKVWVQLSEHGLPQGHRVIGFCPSAKHATKMWPRDSYIDLGRLLVDRHDARILIFGGEEDRTYCSEIADSIEHPPRTESGSSHAEPRRAFNFAGHFSLLESAAAMDNCSVIVTNDTGLMHIAAARKRPVVAIFGSTVEEFGFFPYGTRNIVLQNSGLYCRPCSHIGRSKCPEGHFRCMKEVSVGGVARAVDSLLT